MTKSVTVSIDIKVEGEQGSGKSRVLSAFVQDLAKNGAIKSISVDDEGHTARIVTKIDHD